MIAGSSGNSGPSRKPIAHGSDAQPAKFDYIFKIILIGGQNVGKSSILNRFVDNSFNDVYISTIGVDFRIKTVPVEDKVVKLQIWDTAGQERFGALTSSHYKGAHGCVCVYDITAPKSFQQAQRYLTTAIDQYGIPGESIYLIGNKSDLEQQREVSAADGLKFAQKHSAYFCESSAKNDINIASIFFAMARNLAQHVVKAPKNISSAYQNRGETVGEDGNDDGDLESQSRGAKASYKKRLNPGSSAEQITPVPKRGYCC